MKPTKQQFCIADIRDLFGRFSHAWGRSQGRRCPIRAGYPFLILAALVFLASGLLVGCGGSSYSAPPTPPPPPTLPSAGSLSSACTAAATIGAYNCQIAVSSGKAPFTWNANTLPRGLMLTVSADTTTATISGTVQGQQAITTTSAFTALAATASATTTVSVTLTVTDSANQSASLTFSITLTISSLAITTTSPLPGATLGTAYTTMVTAAGGLTPYTWTVATGSSLPAGLTLASGSPSATISGTPTATGTFTFTLNVADSETPTPMTASATFTLTVSTSSTLNCPSPPVTFTLCGSNVFGIGGFVGTTGPALTAASFVADNSGHVVSGVEDFNSVSGGQANVTITGGSYSVGADGRGILTLIDSNAVTRTFRFVLEGVNAGVAAIEEFDASGTLAAGPMLGPVTFAAIPPNTATIPPNTIFVVQLAGYDSAGKRTGMLGELQVGSSGCNGAANSLNSLAGEPVVTNTAGTVNTALTITGSCTAPDPNTGRGTATIMISGGTLFANNTLNFVFYTVATSTTGLLGVLLGESDAIATNQPILGGLAQVVLPATGAFNACAAPAACILAGVGTTDGTITTGHAVALLVRGVATPANATSGAIAGVLDENFGGTITSGAWPYTSYTIDVNGVGTITGTGPKIHFVADGRFMDESVSVITGDTNVQNTTMIESPGLPYIIGEAIGSSGVGTTPLVPHVVGVVTPTGTMTTGTLPGTVDVSTSAGSVAGALGNGSYTIDSTTGRGTGTANANLAGVPSGVPIVIYANRHRRFSVLDMLSTDPVLLGARLQ
jgi:hypothetical protein